MNKFYITTAIPYVNAKPHIGHALEFIQSDVIARYHRRIGDDVVLLCGGDENALKNVQAAEKAKLPIREFIDENTKSFYELSKKLNVNFDVWQKGSDPKHHSSSQKLWNLCNASGDIYKKNYTGLYCVGCEQFYEKEELIEDNTIDIIPENRKNEMLAFVKQGLKDISISRSNERARNWGVSVPNDPTQKMYVWFDALNIYQSGVGFGSNEEKYNKWWPADLHILGKGILRFHAIYWAAFLLSAGLKLPKTLFVHEYITVGGQKMSKTVGNVLDPIPLIEKYGADALRYYLLAKISPFSDGDFSEEKFKEVYNADLANGLGNLVARAAKLCERNKFDLAEIEQNRPNRILEGINPLLKNFKLNEILGYIWGCITSLDQYINKERPWQKELTEANKILSNIIIGSEALSSLREIAEALRPFLPETAEKIENQFRGPKIPSQPPLFPRI